MTRKYLLLAATGFAALGLGTTAATAQPHGDMFEKADTNGDGVITPAERDTARGQMFDEIDTNADGFVTEEEMKAAHEARREEMRAKMEERRANADGDGERKGWKAKRAMKGKHRGEGDMFEKLDTDGDGTISRTEFVSYEMPHLDKVDANGDGNITREEADAAKEAMREKMKERWGKRKDNAETAE